MLNTHTRGQNSRFRVGMKGWHPVCSVEDRTAPHEWIERPSKMVSPKEGNTTWCLEINYRSRRSDVIIPVMGGQAPTAVLLEAL